MTPPQAVVPPATQASTSRRDIAAKRNSVRKSKAKDNPNGAMGRCTQTRLNFFPGSGNRRTSALESRDDTMIIDGTQLQPPVST